MALVYIFQTEWLVQERSVLLYGIHEMKKLGQLLRSSEDYRIAIITYCIVEDHS